MQQDGNIITKWAFFLDLKLQNPENFCKPSVNFKPFPNCRAQTRIEHGLVLYSNVGSSLEQHIIFFSAYHIFYRRGSKLEICQAS